MNTIKVGDEVEVISGPFEEYIGRLGKVWDTHDGHLEVRFDTSPFIEPMFVLYKASELKKVYEDYTPKDIDDVLQWASLKTKGDNVNNPSHYGQGKIEAIEYIEDFLSTEEYIGYLRGNIGKYLHRWRFKGKPVEDLKKANWYLDRLIEVVDTKQD